MKTLTSTISSDPSILILSRFIQGCGALFGGTLIWPNSFAGAFAPFGKIAGYAGALYSFMQLGGGAGLGWLCFEKIVQR